MPDPNETPAPKPPLIVAEEPEPPPEEPALRAEPAVEDADADHRPPPWAKIPEWGRGRGFPPGVKILFVLLRTDLMRVQTGGEAEAQSHASPEGQAQTQVAGVADNLGPCISRRLCGSV